MQRRFNVYGEIDLEPEIRGPFESLLRREFPEEAAAALPKLGESPATAPSSYPGPASGVSARTNESSLAPTATATSDSMGIRSSDFSFRPHGDTGADADDSVGPGHFDSDADAGIEDADTADRDFHADQDRHSDRNGNAASPDLDSRFHADADGDADSDSDSNRDSDADQDTYCALNRHIGAARYRDADRNEKTDGDSHAGPADRDRDEEARAADRDSTSDPDANAGSQQNAHCDSGAPDGDANGFADADALSAFTDTLAHLDAAAAENAADGAPESRPG